jgi:hypothetical protein
MKRAQFIFTLLWLILPGAAEAQEQPLPSFKDYPVQGMFSGTPAEPKLTDARSRMFRTNIRAQTAEGPNFGGHYRIATWGCGTACIQFAIIDCKTGRVYFPPMAETIGAVIPPGQSEEMLAYRSDSRLLIIAGAKDDSHRQRTVGRFFYEWKNGRLALIRRENLAKN